MLTPILLKLLKNDPVDRQFGFGRGEPIDRYYIESFLAQQQHLICGDVMEISESTYTKRFGQERVRRSLILHATEGLPDADYIGDLSSGEGIPVAAVDCFILTQTLPFIYDVKSAIANALKTLRAGGHLLITVAGITQISRYDMDRWGHYWSFTDLSLRRLLEEVVPPESIQIQTYGNAKAAACFLYGLAQQDLSRRELDITDRDYQVVITAVVKKT